MNRNKIEKMTCVSLTPIVAQIQVEFGTSLMRELRSDIYQEISNENFRISKMRFRLSRAETFRVRRQEALNSIGAPKLKCQSVSELPKWATDSRGQPIPSKKLDQKIRTADDKLQKLKKKNGRKSNNFKLFRPFEPEKYPRKRLFPIVDQKPERPEKVQMNPPNTNTAGKE